MKLDYAKIFKCQVFRQVEFPSKPLSNCNYLTGKIKPPEIMHQSIIK